MNIPTELLQQMKEEQFEYIIALARGGMVPATYVAYALNIKNIELLVVSSDKKLKTSTITEKDLNMVEDKKVLLIDDLVDSGDSLRSSIDYIKKFNAKLIKTFVMYRKSNTTFEPDYYLEDREGDKWINFDWEKYE